MDTIYSMSRGLSPDQQRQLATTPAPRNNKADDDAFIARANQLFGSTPYKGSAQTAPYNIYGGAEEHAPANFTGSIEQQAGLVHGQNIQPDIPNDQPAGTVIEQGTGNALPPVQDNLPLQQATVQQPLDVGMDMKPADWKWQQQPDKQIATNKVPESHAEAAKAAVTSSMPQATTPVQAATQQADQDRIHKDIDYIANAKNPKKAWQEVKQDPFYKSSDFYTGLMGVGLAIMSGANPMQAYQAGQGMMDKAQLSTQMGQNRQALIDQGYSPASVEAAITSGDASKLKMQEMSDQDRMAAEDQLWGKRQGYEQQVAEKNRQEGNVEWDRRTAIQQANTMQQQAAADRRAQLRADEAERRQKDMFDYRMKAKQEAAKQAANSLEFDSRAVNAEAKAGGYNSNRQWIDKAQSFNVAAKDLQQIQQHMDKGNDQGARSAYQQTVLNLIRGEVGPNRAIQPEDVKAFGGDPSMWVSEGNSIKMKAGAAPTKQAVSYLDESIKTGLTSANQGIADFKRSRINSLMSSGYDPRRATALVNKTAGGEFYDPYNAFGGAPTDADVQGVSASQGALGTSAGGFQF